MSNKIKKEGSNHDRRGVLKNLWRSDERGRWREE
jgi:hypothetical protein